MVVESPAKAKTIEKYLGGDFTVRASYGHIRDLPKSPKLGVDVEHDFAPRRTWCPRTPSGTSAELKQGPRRAPTTLILATDYDREGEAIAFHVATLLGVDPRDAKRVTFTEITKDAILEAFRHPRAIDMRLVRRAAGPPDPRPARGLPDLARSCGSGSARACRPAACSRSRCG